MSRKTTHRPRIPRALTALVLAATPLASTLAGCTQRPEPAPHILLISVDTLRRDGLRAFDPGAQELPTLDALASRSVRFTHAISPASWTLPAHASLLTGLYPHRHGAIHRLATLSPDVPTLAQGLAARGYQTVAFTDGGFVDSSYGLARGFERYDGDGPPGQPAPAWLPDGGRPQPVRGSDLFARAIAWLEHRQPGRPVFLFAHTYAVHDYYRGLDSGSGTNRLTRTASDVGIACLLGTRQCPPQAWRQLADDYRRQLERLDGGIARLLASAQAGLGDRPLWIVLLSDHGEGLDPANGRIHHGGRLTADLLSVPLLISAPGLTPRDIDAPTSLIDLMPTLLAVAGAADKRSAALDGTSLLPLLRDRLGARSTTRELARRTLQAEEHYYWWRDGRRRGSREVPRRPLAVAVVDEGWWYVRGLAGEEVAAWESAKEASPPLPLLRRLARPVLTTTATATAQREESDEEAAELRALGYGG